MTILALLSLSFGLLFAAPGRSEPPAPAWRLETGG
jgi:hypothetical protein